MEAPATEGLWSPRNRSLTLGLVLTITLVASEALAVSTILPDVRDDLGGIRLYGWVYSAFMLSSLVGIVAAGRAADRQGPAVPYATGLVLFASGLLVGGLAPSMPVLVAGRALQGLGAGAVPAVAYVAIGRSLPASLQPRMFAVLSTAWVVPGLAGPALSAFVAHQFGWRWVFLGLIPLVAVSGPICVPALVRLGPPPQRDGESAAPAQPHSIVDAFRVALGAGLLLGGLTAFDVIVTPVLVAVGLVTGVPSLRRLVPEGTLRARAGLPATILTRGLVAFAFFGADGYVSFVGKEIRHHSTILGGIALTAATLTWTGGAWLQAAWADRMEGRRLVRMGVVLILVGIGCVAVTLRQDVPAGMLVVAWAIAGLGMGLSYAPISLLMLRAAASGAEGAASASLTLLDTLGIALGTGVGGAAVSAAQSLDRPSVDGIVVLVVCTAIAGLGCLAVTRRLPGDTLAGEPTHVPQPIAP
jgi:MFS family permease